MYLTNLYPKPLQIAESPKIRFSFGSRVAIYLAIPDTSPSKVAHVVDRMKYLWNCFTRTASILDVRLVDSHDGTYRIYIGEPLEVPAKPKYYEILADEGGILLSACSFKALIDSFTTLVQLICPVCLDEGREEFYITGTHIVDKPSLKFRSIHLCVFPESELSTIEKAIHMAGFLKFTHIILEFWGTLQYETMPELAWSGYSHSKAEIKPLIDLAHSYGMEVIPMINHFGHASSSRSCYGRHTVLNANPRRAKLFEPDGWTWCLSNPDTYKLLSEMRAELLDLCGEGSYFHLGFDEAYSFATCDACRKRVSSELLADYINRLTDDLAVHNRRPIIWHDELIKREDFAEKIPDPVVANGQVHGTASALSRIDRSVIIADWQYEYRTTGENGNLNPTASYFTSMGFDTILCPWDDMTNIRVLCEDARLMSAYGIMLTTWHHLSGFLQKFLTASNLVWQPHSPYKTAPITEAAAILRTVYPTNGDYTVSGWNKFEVEG